VSNLIHFPDTPENDWPLRMPESVGDVARSFIVTCLRAGFASTPSEPLLTRDPTLLFANSTIVRFKDRLARGVREPGFCLVQPCIRVQNLRLIRSGAPGLAYMSCFNQAGTIAPATGLGRTLSCIDRVMDDLGLAGDRIVVKTNRAMLANAEVDRWLRNHPSWQVEIDTAPPGYYEWSYGMPGVDGIGLTFALRDGKGDAASDFGNLVAIRAQRSMAAWEFGFGLETLDARMRSHQTPFESSAVYMALREALGAPPDRGLCDVLQLSAALHCLGIREGSGKRESIMRRALIDAVFLSLRSGLDLDALVRVANRICKRTPVGLQHTYETAWRRIERKLSLVNDFVCYARRHGKPDARILEYAQVDCGLPSAFMDVVRTVTRWDA
jgi:hypothetical protein